MSREPAYDAVNASTFWVVIRMEERLGGKRIGFWKWENLSWEVRNKWGWYFKYRAALAQVQNPRAHVEMAWGTTPKPNAEQITRQNKVRAKKAKITEISNKMRKAREAWRDIFPITDHPKYQAAARKLSRLQQELVELEGKEAAGA
jgi:hypothetical protein